jgi:hypothetical protein
MSVRVIVISVGSVPARALQSRRRGQPMRPVDHVVERFPERRELVQRLYLRDDMFRSMCEDFALSVSSPRVVERRPDAHLRPEVDDYRTVLRELEEENRDYLTAAEGARPRGFSTARRLRMTPQSGAVRAPAA